MTIARTYIAFVEGIYSIHGNALSYSVLGRWEIGDLPMAYCVDPFHANDR